MVLKKSLLQYPPLRPSTYMMHGSNTTEYRSVRQWRPSISPPHTPRALSLPSTNSLNSCTLLLKYIEQPPSVFFITSKLARHSLPTDVELPFSFKLSWICQLGWQLRWSDLHFYVCCLSIGARASSSMLLLQMFIGARTTDMLTILPLWQI